MDIFESALSVGADADANLDAELASDTDAVVSVIYAEQAKIGHLLSTSDGAVSRPAAGGRGERRQALQNAG